MAWMVGGSPVDVGATALPDAKPIAHTRRSDVPGGAAGLLTFTPGRQARAAACGWKQRGGTSAGGEASCGIGVVAGGGEGGQVVGGGGQGGQALVQQARGQLLQGAPEGHAGGPSAGVGRRGGGPGGGGGGGGGGERRNRGSAEPDLLQPGTRVTGHARQLTRHRPSRSPGGEAGGIVPSLSLSLSFHRRPEVVYD